MFLSGGIASTVPRKAPMTFVSPTLATGLEGDGLAITSIVEWCSALDHRNENSGSDENIDFGLKNAFRVTPMDFSKTATLHGDERYILVVVSM